MNNKINKLSANNIKILKVIEIKPKGNIILFTGNNEQGKTSALDCIEWGLAGVKTIDEKPVREGEESGHIRIELDDLIITRRFVQREGKKYTTSLKVQNKEGSTFESPQKILDKLIGGLNFDPLKFSSMKPKEQFEELRKVLKIDFDFEEHERKRDEIYDERTYTNKGAKQLEGEIAGIQYPIDTPDIEIDTGKLSNVLENSLEINRNIVLTKNNIENNKKNLELYKRNIEGEIKRHKDNIEILKLKILKTNKIINEDNNFLNGLSFYENDKIEEIRNKINNSSEINKNVSYKRRKQELNEKLGDKKEISNRQTEEIKRLDVLKANEISKVEMPIKGLELGNYEITYKGLPFAQLNSAKRLEISCAIAMNSEKKLKVIRIENGSLLDDKNLKVIEQMAIKYDHQVWIEKVDSSGEIGIVFEDGKIKKVN